MKRGAQVGKTLAGNGNVVLCLMGIDLPSVRAHESQRLPVSANSPSGKKFRIMRVLCGCFVFQRRTDDRENDLAGILYESKFYFSLVTLPLFHDEFI